VTRIQTAIAANVGGMGSLGVLTSGQITSIASALAAIAPTTEACGSCHAIPPATGRHAKHSSFSCANCHGVGYSKSSVNASTHNNGTVNLANATGWVVSTKSCTNGCHGMESWLGSRDD
jgi:DnaJ-class molecular chaperone